LSAELLRKGRFDEIFFVDLPQASVRGEIFAMHSARRKLDPASFDLPVLDDDGNRTPPDQATLLNALKRTRPLSVLMREQVEALRA
jgi:SpoVK/Ycf46/Vps4 family AAA+-type ATPase